MIIEQVTNDIYELCIIGSGPAGIITALEYCALNPTHKVLMIEYGSKDQSEKNALDDSIQLTNMTNHHPPYECTNKGIGGTSATWGGRCVMYDETDFLQRDILNGDCTWDTDLYNDIQQYLEKTSAYFECGEPVFNSHYIKEFADKPIAEGFKEGVVTDSCLERWSMPTRFGERYKKAIAEQPRLFLLQGYEARQFSIPTGAGNVSSLLIRRVVSSEIATVKSKRFVLAAGTQETTRLLLRNQQIFSNLNSTPNALGKYYQGHLSGKIASVKFKGDPKKTNYGFLRDKEGIYLRRRFQFSTAFLVKKNLLNTAIWLDNPLYFDPAHKSGAMSFMYLAMLMPVLRKKLAPPAILHSITKGKVNAIDKHLWNIVKDFPKSLSVPATIFYRRYLLKRKLPGVFLYSPENRYALHFHSEQLPDAENRMELGDDGETLVIHYSLSEKDINSVIELHKALDHCLRACDCGELEYWYQEKELPDKIRSMSKDGIHQSGTTRIGDSPEKGVVDSNLKTWGTSNLYVCSSSVFPTSGQANPTFLLGAFAVRLAKHLRENNENN